MLRKLQVLLFITLLSLTGCSDSLDLVSRLGTDTDSRVPHRSWGSYRLYQFQNGEWQTLVDLGRATSPVPRLDERPVLIVHGLGATIKSSGQFDDLAENLLANGATSVFGFEYDSLDPIESNSQLLAQALDYLTSQESTRTFRFVAHSMGALVLRSRLESGTNFDMAASGNLVSLVAGPHLGSPVAAELQMMDQNLAQQAVRQLVLNGELLFFNADGQPVDVMGDEPSFLQLVPGSDFLNSLNDGAAAKHPQFVYRTMAGNDRGLNYELFDRLIGVFADDGIVNVESANAEVVGQVATVEAPYDHTQIVMAQASQLVILVQLGLLQ